MSEEKQANAQILFYADCDPYFQALPLEVVGRITKEAFNYVLRGERKDTFDDLEAVAQIFANQTILKVKDNAEKYSAKCVQNSINRTGKGKNKAVDPFP